MTDTRQPGPLRWGILGATAYISGLLITAIKLSHNGVLVALASRPHSADRAEALAHDHRAMLHKDYEALLSDPDIDAVYIPLPNTDHVEWTLRALAAGKHVLVEKPIAMSEADCRRIENAATQAGRAVMEAFMYRFHPQQHRAAELLAAGAVGDLRLVRASFAFAIESGSGNIRLNPELGGGATWDVGCYAVDVPLLFFDRAPQRVRAESTTRPGLQVDTSVAALLDFGDGRRAVIDYSIDYGPRAWYELQGETGTITVYNAWAIDEPGRITIRTQQGEREEQIRPAHHYEREVTAFAESVLDGRPVPLPLASSRRTTQVCASLVRSADADGAPLHIEEAS
jgi:D-xylose 1-dehydrogenase (NADP+, D-xylono-1,5-lactone-forming)